MYEATEMTEMTELEELEGIYSELHKEVYGMKARWYIAASIEQARADIDCLQARADIDCLQARGEVIWADRRAEQVRSTERFEQLIVKTVDSGAGDRVTALRWIMQAEGEQDTGMMEYTLGIPYGTFK